MSLNNLGRNLACAALLALFPMTLPAALPADVDGTPMPSLAPTVTSISSRQS